MSEAAVRVAADDKELDGLVKAIGELHQLLLDVERRVDRLERICTAVHKMLAAHNPSDARHIHQ